MGRKKGFKLALRYYRIFSMSQTKYYVLDHHSIWGWKKTEDKLEDAQIVFVWNDFTIEEDVKRWQNQGKKVVCFEHGWNAFFDYEYNKRKMIADGYMSLGYSTSKSLISYSLDNNKLLVSGNPNFDSLIHESSSSKNDIPKVLYTALHWTRDMKDYNNSKLNEIITVLSPFTDIAVKTIEKSKIYIPDSVTEWRSEINNNMNLFAEINEGLKEYDIILTPKESTFDFIAIKMGKKVFRIGRQEEYWEEGDPKTRNILEFSNISTDLLYSNTKPMVDLNQEINQSLKIDEIIKWAIKL